MPWIDEWGFCTSLKDMNLSGTNENRKTWEEGHSNSYMTKQEQE
jgi:hypothetical protein